MIQSTKILSVVLSAAVLLCGCTARNGPNAPGTESRTDPSEAPTSHRESQRGEDISQAQEPENPASQDQGETYIDQLVRQTIAEFAQPGMSEFEKAKAAFDYMIENTALLDPVGLELWRVRGDNQQPPSFVENRSLSVLLFHLGKCEDYAAALTLLLQGMGLEAQYVPGLTYSTQGELVDHAWTVAKVDGVWYHLDCQLEQNISRHGSVRYKYFMRGDGTMSGSHRWGQNLIDSGLLTAAQNEEIAASHIPPPCPQDYPTPARAAVTPIDDPDVEAIEAAVAQELREYERLHGPLEPLELNIIPPVFALEGYGPQD